MDLKACEYIVASHAVHYRRVRLWIGTIERLGPTILDERHTFSVVTAHDYGLWIRGDNPSRLPSYDQSIEYPSKVYRRRPLPHVPHGPRRRASVNLRVDLIGIRRVQPVFFREPHAGNSGTSPVLPECNPSGWDLGR